MIQASSSLGLRSGMIFGVPIPDSYEAAGARIQEAVEQAVEEAARAGIDKRGKEVTPWLLKRVSELTTEAADSNSALIKNNATVAARTAVELAQLDVEKAELAKEQGQKVYASAETPLTASSPVSST